MFQLSVAVCERQCVRLSLFLVKLKNFVVAVVGYTQCYTRAPALSYYNTQTLIHKITQQTR